MSKLKKLKKLGKVLCKRTSAIGKNHWWDKNASPPVRHDRENRMLVEGDWYDIIEWEKDGFRIIDNQGNRHYFAVYEDGAKFPGHCDMFGPGDYAKWFYTPEELEQVEAGTYQMSYKEKHAISVFPGNYHWVKLKVESVDEGQDPWIIAKCRQKNRLKPGTFFWDTMQHHGILPSCDDFEAIGEEVVSRERQIEDANRKVARDKLNDELAVLVDAINKNDPDKEYPSVEYIMPFVNKAYDEYFDIAFSSFSDMSEPLDGSIKLD